MDHRKRYQIFVSSTFQDLEVERGKVMETILNFDCFPAGMELFPAMDEDIFKYIKRIIDESDYYLMVIGGRYGSVDKSGKSWTEREYDYAVSRGIPVLVFDHEDFTLLPANKTDQGRKRNKLIAFKKKASAGRLIKRWTNADNLASVVATSLKSVLELQPRIGWVRADNMIVSGDSQKEIERLRKEIAQHLEQITKLEIDLKDFQDLESKYQAAQKEIKNLEEQKENHKKRIKVLEAEVKRLKPSQPQTEAFTVRGVSFKMVHVEGGKFLMGADKGDEDAYDIEKPAHKVTLSDYWIGETQVTQALWNAVLGKNPSRFTGDPNRPVEYVSWRDCQVFIKKLNDLTGKTFRLPTEAEWEFAARGGSKSKGYKYPGSNYVSVVAWNIKNSNGQTHPVGEKSPNELGLYDICGNVWEWCQDWYGNYREQAQTNPKGPAKGYGRVFRGGSWDSLAGYCSVSYRSSSAPTSSFINLGLRLAL